VEVTTPPRLIKGISHVLEHSGKCGRTTDSVASKCVCMQRAFQLISGQYCNRLAIVCNKLSPLDTFNVLTNLDIV
ncbi:unnamed protein product, partial [Hymenolepis diminuta]